ncbi:MAG: hypothetical protein ACYDBH_01115 [Acidobacteriaceae bacterium]
MSFTSQNFMKTTSPQNSFLLQTQGYVQGVMLPDPVAQQWILSGLLSNSATAPVYAGLPVTETNPGPDYAANAGGSIITQAGTNGVITGFSIINQAYNGIITNSNEVPLFAPGMSLNYMRFGSNARIVVPVDAGAISGLENQPINVQMSWDFTTNALTTYNATTGALPVKLLLLNANSKIVNYNSTTQVASWNTGTVAVIQI